MTPLRNRGFTLIELLVVIAIIGLLSSIVMASLNTARMKGRDSARITDVKQIQLALELYFESCREYPATLESSAANGCSGSTDFQDFLNPIPLSPTGEAYEYGVEADNSSYVIAATLEDDGSVVLLNDIDDETFDITCADPVYCLTP